MDDDLPPCPAVDAHPQHLSGRAACDMSIGHPEDPVDARHSARIGTHTHRW